MKAIVEDTIKSSLEKTHDIAITYIETLDGITYDVEGFGKNGLFKTKVALLIVEVGANHVHNQR